MEYNDILNKINEVQAKITVLKENIYSVKGISYDDIPKGTNGNADIIFFLIEIEESEKELEELKEKKNIIKSKHEKEIEKVNNDKYRSILRMYYLNKFNIIKIAELMGISESYARNLKKKAISQFMIENSIK
jgi:DNA-directed RNA polymerase specialized sigma subunit